MEASVGPLKRVLELFRSEYLADALYAVRQPTTGSKEERVERLLRLGLPAGELLDCFTADAIRDACDCADLPAGRKADMIGKLLEPGSAHLAPVPQRTRQAPTLEATLAALASMTVPRRKASNEGTAEEFIGAFLDERFTPVAHQYSVGGFLGTRIDVDLGDGAVGVEVKLASSVTKASEMHRMLGQAYQYDRRRYAGRLIVALVGSTAELEAPLVAEMTELLRSLNVNLVPIRIV